LTPPAAEYDPRMSRRVAAVAMVCAWLVAPAGAAHEKFKIVGTIAKVHAEQLDVKSVDGSTYEMDMFESAAILRRNKKVARTELKPGLKVTVHALGHDFFDLEVVEVHINE
jgi:hypothetical protein